MTVGSVGVQGLRLERRACVVAKGEAEAWNEFVTWLAAQSDFTLGNPGNQRITLERLTAFVNGKRGPFGY